MAQKTTNPGGNVSRRTKIFQCYKYIKQGHNKGQVERVAGLYRREARYMSTWCIRTGGVDNCPHNCRPRTWAPGLWDEATQVLLEGQDVWYMATALAAEFCSRGIRKRPSKTAACMRRWTADGKIRAVLSALDSPEPCSSYARRTCTHMLSLLGDDCGFSKSMASAHACVWLRAPTSTVPAPSHVSQA